VEIGGAFHIKCFMGPFDIELMNEGIEAVLLLQAIEAGRTDRFRLEGEMHALVAAVLLRMPRLDALDGDAKPESIGRSAQYLSFPKASTVRPSAGMMYPEPLAYGTKVR
jgi:hypothetical protein